LHVPAFGVLPDFAGRAGRHAHPHAAILPAAAIRIVGRSASLQHSALPPDPRSPHDDFPSPKRRYEMIRPWLRLGHFSVKISWTDPIRWDNSGQIKRDFAVFKNDFYFSCRMRVAMGGSLFPSRRPRSFP
jgi:hypothetical protein